MKHYLKQTECDFFSFVAPLALKLKSYEEFLKKWQQRINLIAPSTIPLIYQRHILDSIQLWPLISKQNGILTDMGSGAGFPGILLALCNEYLDGNFQEVRLIESDTRKCIFLKEVVRLLDLKRTTIINQRIEKVNLPLSDVITARALSDLSTLLSLSGAISGPKTKFLFLKGNSVDKEIDQLSNEWCVEKYSSQTDIKGCIVEITKKDKK